MAFDIRQLARRGLLQAGQSFAWHWSSGGTAIGSVGVAVDANEVVLSFHRTRNGEAKSAQCHLWLDCSNGGYGSRRMFSCPSCRKRCAVVYFGGFGWACRKCLKLVYASEAEDTMGRLWRKQRKVESRLQWDGQEPLKPTGMHWRTFERLTDRIDEIEQEKDYVFAASCGPLFRRLGLNYHDL